MARKVGFDTGQDRKGIADRVLDDHRAKAREKREVEQARVAARKSRPWFAIIFLFVWLCGWTVGIVFVGFVIIGGDAEPFLFVWEALAIAGWLVAFGVFVKLLLNR